MNNDLEKAEKKWHDPDNDPLHYRVNYLRP